jgi:hypothetical protein
MSIPVNYGGGLIVEIQMQPDEINYMTQVIDKELPTNGLMVEWGCGGSTCKWLELLSNGKRLITVEHNLEWYNKVAATISKEFKNFSSKFQLHHIPEQMIKHEYGTVVEEFPMGLDNYLAPNIKGFWDADLFFIDGIGRAACALSVLVKHTKKDPIVFIHDYVGRESWYSWASQFYDVEIVGSTLARLRLKKESEDKSKKQEKKIPQKKASLKKSR